MMIYLWIECLFQRNYKRLQVLQTKKLINNIYNMDMCFSKLCQNSFILNFVFNWADLSNNLLIKKMLQLIKIEKTFF
jgi:hypothetical protein